MNTSIQLRVLLTGVGIAALCIVVVAVGIAGVELTGHQGAGRGGASTIAPSPTSTDSGTLTPTCDAPGKPACPTPNPGWIPLASASPNDVLAAMKQSWIFHIDLSDGGDHIQDLSHLGAPIFVRGLAPRGARIPNFYLLPFMNARRVITDVGTFELNAQRNALRLQGVSSVDGRYPIVRQTLTAAVNALWRQRHISPLAHSQRYLIYFSTNAFDIQTHKVVWNAGGLGPAVPLWLVPGSDGQNYIFGNDGNIYAESELPLGI